MEFSCYKEGCPFEGPGSYVVKIAPEAYIDEHNYATIFCPHCQISFESLTIVLMYGESVLFSYHF